MRNAFFFVCVSILVLAFTSPVMADNVKMKDNPKCKQWHSLIGKWTGEFEIKESPTAEWEKLSRKYEFEWILDGAAVQFAITNSEGVSWHLVWGYDTHSETHVGGGFNSLGGREILESGGWNGTTWVQTNTTIDPDGKMTKFQCTVVDNSDFTAATIECQKLTNGKWWTYYRAKDRKVE